jgi:hypothetical protein
MNVGTKAGARTETRLEMDVRVAAAHNERRLDSTSQQSPSSPLVLLKTLRRLSPTVMEGLLSHLSGGALLVAGLAYGLRVPIQALKCLQLRDIHGGGKSLEIDGKRYSVPAILVEDLREFVQGRVCGFEATTSVYRRDQALFGGEAFNSLNQHVAHCISQGGWNWLHPQCAELFGGVVSERFISTCLVFLSKAHSRGIPVPVPAAKRVGVRGKRQSPPPSALTPLDLLDKGPRIVRRARSGAIAAYYLWRFSGE